MPTPPKNPLPTMGSERAAHGMAAVDRAEATMTMADADQKLPGKRLGARVLNNIDVRSQPPRPAIRRVTRGRR